MQGPTPRQQAGYLRRLLRRGEIQVIDPVSSRVLPTIVELADGIVRIVPALRRGALGEATAANEQRWLHLLRRLRERISLEEAEELVEAVEIERARRDPSKS
jgi:hypothetical protein